MKTFRERRDVAVRRSLDVLPMTKRPTLSAVGARPHACGPCQACCEVQRIYVLDKPAFARCPHQCDTGCDVYGSHPTECREYRCAWSLGALTGGEEMRPDVLGMFVDFRPALDEHGLPHPESEDLVCAWETRPDVAVSDAGWAFLLRLAAHRRNTALVPWGAPQLDEARINFIRLWSTVASKAEDGLLNRYDHPRARQELARMVEVLTR